MVLSLAFTILLISTGLPLQSVGTKPSPLITGFHILGIRKLQFEGVDMGIGNYIVYLKYVGTMGCSTTSTVFNIVSIRLWSPLTQSACLGPDHMR